MTKKLFVLTAVSVKLAILGLLGQWAVSPADTTQTNLRADCPWCMPDPDCYPGDPCANC